MRRGLAIACAAAAALVPVQPAAAALFVEFVPHRAQPGDQVNAQATGLGIATGPATLLFLVPPGVDTKTIKSARDPRLIPVGPLTNRPQGAGVTFLVPDVPNGVYSQAYLCPRCGAYSFGRTFFVLDPADAQPAALLTIGPAHGSASWYPWIGAGLVAVAALGWGLQRRRRPR